MQVLCDGRRGGGGGENLHEDVFGFHDLGHFYPRLRTVTEKKGTKEATELWPREVYIGTVEQWFQLLPGYTLPGTQTVQE
jgi:hypothetical protein